MGTEPNLWYQAKSGSVPIYLTVIGLIGFLYAGIMGFWLLLSIIRHGRIVGRGLG